MTLKKPDTLLRRANRLEKAEVTTSSDLPPMGRKPFRWQIWHISTFFPGD